VAIWELNFLRDSIISRVCVFVLGGASHYSVSWRRVGGVGGSNRRVLSVGRVGVGDRRVADVIIGRVGVDWSVGGVAVGGIAVGLMALSTDIIFFIYNHDHDSVFFLYETG
jgi:hypothetical protein